jgi:hypothetical protein
LFVTFAVALLGIAACTDDQPTAPATANNPSFNRSTAPGQQRAAGLDAEFVQIAQSARGFGGMFYDANGRLNIYITQEGRQSQQAQQTVLETARASLQTRGHLAPLAAQIAVLEGTRDYVELVTLRNRMSPVLSEAGVVFTDIDEAHNRLRVGVLAGVSTEQVEAALDRLGVPLDAVSVEITEPIVPLATLHDALDPIGGGLQIWRLIQPSTAGVCTLGFNARLAGNNEELYFFTNSHCTEQRGVVNGTLFRQGPLSFATRTVAEEVADPPFFTCEYIRYRCRYSDAALAQYFPEFDVQLGMIYQTTFFGTTGAGSIETLVPRRAFSIVAERAFPVLGEVLDKVGRTTGWTRGPVIGTCIDTGVAGANPATVMLCQDFVGAANGGGDSGSPVFQAARRRNDVTLYGILWGGSGNQYVFSALDNIRAEFAAFQTH